MIKTSKTEKTKQVWLLWHTHLFEDDTEHNILVGIYSTRKKAQEAKTRKLVEPGFRDFPKGFSIARCPMDIDRWSAGFEIVY